MHPKYNGRTREKNQTGPWSTKRTISPISRAENEEETTAGYYNQIVCFINQNDYLVFLNTCGNYYMHYRIKRNTVNVGFCQRNILLGMPEDAMQRKTIDRMASFGTF